MEEEYNEVGFLVTRRVPGPAFQTLELGNYTDFCEISYPWVAMPTLPFLLTRAAWCEKECAAGSALCRTHLGESTQFFWVVEVLGLRNLK